MPRSVIDDPVDEAVSAAMKAIEPYEKPGGSYLLGRIEIDAMMRAGIRAYHEFMARET